MKRTPKVEKTFGVHFMMSLPLFCSGANVAGD